MKANFDRAVPRFIAWGKGQHEKVKKDLGVWTAFSRWIAIPDANITPKQINDQLRANEEAPLPDKKAWEQAKKIRSGCERKSTNFVIQGSAADVIKISLVKLFKEFLNRGWTRNGDDSVRMIMTIHDEIVFEIKHERLQEAVPIIVDIMEYPSQMVKWRVPLIVDATIGQTWAADISWTAIMSGKEPVPAWLEGLVVPKPPEPKLELPKPEASPKAPEPDKPLPTPEQEPVVSEARQGPPAPDPVHEEEDSADKGPRFAFAKGVVFSISHTLLMRANSVEVVRIACQNAQHKDGPVLQLTDDSGNILIPWRLKVHVDPDRLAKEMAERNLAANPKYSFQDPSDLN